MWYTTTHIVLICSIWSKTFLMISGLEMVMSIIIFGAALSSGMGMMGLIPVSCKIFACSGTRWASLLSKVLGYWKIKEVNFLKLLPGTMGVTLQKLIKSWWNRNINSIIATNFTGKNISNVSSPYIVSTFTNSRVNLPWWSTCSSVFQRLPERAISLKVSDFLMTKSRTSDPHTK